MKKLSQVIVLSKMKFASEFWKKLFESKEIKCLVLDEYGDFAHFADDLDAELILVDLKLLKEETFEGAFKEELSKLSKKPFLLFMGTEKEWEEGKVSHALGKHLLTPIDIKSAISQVETLFSSKNS